VSQLQITRSAERIRDPALRLSFVQRLQRADALVSEARRLRLEAWADFRAATGETKRTEKVVGQYA
jgi:hypothetical protein